MAYCMECGKITEGDQPYCAEHSNPNSNQQQTTQNTSFFTDKAQQVVNNSVPVNNTNFAPQPVYTGNYPYTAPAKKAPLWMFPVFALVAEFATGILSTIGSLILTAIINNVYFVDTEYLYYLTSGNIIPNIVFFVCTVACIILYNKNCQKNGLENSVFPVYYCGIFFVCRILGSIVGSLISNVIHIILSIVSENTYLPFDFFDAYTVISAITSFIGGIVFIISTFFVFTIIHKKQTKS